MIMYSWRDGKYLLRAKVDGDFVEVLDSDLTGKVVWQPVSDQYYPKAIKTLLTAIEEGGITREELNKRGHVGV